MNPLIKSFCQRRRYLQSNFLFKRFLHVSKFEISTFPWCSSLPSLDAGLRNHGYLIKCGFFGYCVDVGNDLLWLYTKHGEFEDAYKVFEEMPMRSKEGVFDHIIYWLRVNRTYEDVVIAFEKIVQFRVCPSVQSLCHVIRACSHLNNIEKGYFVHDYVEQNGYADQVLVMNLLISMYVQMCRLDLAEQVFEKVIHKDIVSWNSLITGYARNQNHRKVFDLFLRLTRAENLVPNVVTFLALLSSVGHGREVSIGKSIHGHLIRLGLYLDVQLGTAILDMYAKCERLDYALFVFEHDLMNKTLVSWNALIATYKQKGYNHEAIDIYERLVMEPNLKPDSFSFANVLPAYANLRNIQRIKSIHSMIIKNGVKMESDVVLSTAMLDAYGKCSDVKTSKSLFVCIQHPSTATWNALISVYNLNNEIENGMITFQEMVRRKVLIDSVSMVALFQSCGQLGFLNQGNMIHGFCISKGFSSHLIVGNALIDMYMRCKCTKSAELISGWMPKENIVTWNTMINGYIKNGYSSTGLELFHQMQSEKNYKPDSVTIISLLHGSIAISDIYIELFHAYILKLGLDSETTVMNTMIDGFSKIGSIKKAKALFTQNDFKKDQSSWNIMISGYGMNGQGIESCKVFGQMLENGCEPDAITFISLLSSCSHCGLIEDGCKFFDLMIRNYKIQPTMEHWTCVIDMLGRANGLEEAYDVIKTGIYEKSGNFAFLDSMAVWGALLSACKINMNMKVGEVVGERLSKMESDCLYNSLLSNLYSSNKKWDEATEIRRVFGDRKGVKKVGLSSLKS